MNTLTAIDLLTYIGFPAFVGIVTFIVKNIFDRVSQVELKVNNATTHNDVRQILADKLDPIKEDITEIKKQLDLLLSLYLKDKK